MSGDSIDLSSFNFVASKESEFSSHISLDGARLMVEGQGSWCRISLEMERN